MKKLLYLTLLLAALGACTSDFDLSKMQSRLDKAEVSLSESNTYYVGEPVKFNISGDPDNIIFFGGDAGHCYEFKDRTNAPPAEGSKIFLTMTIGMQYGAASETKDDCKYRVMNGALPEFTKDAAADRAMVTSQDWVTLFETYRGDSRLNEEITFDLTDYSSEPFTLAVSNTFRALRPDNGAPNNASFQQAKLWMQEPNGIIRQIATNANIAPMRTLCMYEGHTGEEVYKSGTFIRTGALNRCSHWGFKSEVFTAYGANDYAWNTTAANFPAGTDLTSFDNFEDTWLFLTPIDVTQIAPDRGIAIKDMSSAMSSFSYTYNTPGTYKVTYVLNNTSTSGKVEKTKEFTITITEDPNKPKPEEKASIELDPDNIYLEGKPIKFIVSGAARSAMFFSGETGHEYRYKDRTHREVPDGSKLFFNFKANMIYGSLGYSETYGNNFQFKATNDHIAPFTQDITTDRAVIKAADWTMLNSWKKSGGLSASNSQYTEVTTDISSYMGGEFSLAFSQSFLAAPPTGTCQGNTISINSPELYIVDAQGTKEVIATSAQLLNAANYRVICMHDQCPSLEKFLYAGGSAISWTTAGAPWDASCGACGHWFVSGVDFKSYMERVKLANKPNQGDPAGSVAPFDDPWLLFGPYDIFKVNPDTGVSVPEGTKTYSYSFTAKGDYVVTLIYRDGDKPEEFKKEFTITIN